MELNFNNSSLLNEAIGNANLKPLSPLEYVDILSLKQGLKDYISDSDKKIGGLIAEYNKEFNTKIAPKQKELGNSDLTTLSMEEISILNQTPPVKIVQNRPVCDDPGFWEKFYIIRSLIFKPEKLNFIEKIDIFKSVFDGVNVDGQLICFKKLLSKQIKKLN